MLFRSGLFKCYKNPILVRELEELIYVPDAKGRYKRRKIDHPKYSIRRRHMEGIKKGSKDVSDGVAGATFKCIDDNRGLFRFGLLDIDKKDDRIKHPKEVEEDLFESMRQRVREDHAEEARKELIKITTTGQQKKEYWQTLIDSY